MLRLCALVFSQICSVGRKSGEGGVIANMSMCVFVWNQDTTSDLSGLHSVVVVFCRSYQGVTDA